MPSSWVATAESGQYVHFNLSHTVPVYTMCPGILLSDVEEIDKTLSDYLPHPPEVQTYIHIHAELTV